MKKRKTLLLIFLFLLSFATAQDISSYDFNGNNEVDINDIKLLISMSERTTRGCGLLIIDIDNFKDFNDKFGHFEGDQLLRTVTQNIEQSLRNYDKIHIYRYGGEEFVVIIPDTSSNNALAIGERLRKNVRKACDVTVSIGVSHYKELAGNINELITNADKALYKAKRAGKDKVLLYEKTP